MLHCEVKASSAKRTGVTNMHLLVYATVGSIIGLLLGVVAGALRYVLARFTQRIHRGLKTRPYGKGPSPLRHVLLWCKTPVLVCVPMCVAAGVLIGWALG